MANKFNDFHKLNDEVIAKREEYQEKFDIDASFSAPGEGNFSFNRKKIKDPDPNAIVKCQCCTNIIEYVESGAFNYNRKFRICPKCMKKINGVGGLIDRNTHQIKRFRDV